MIGNDVIDLELAASESNWQRRGFLEKLFTKEEQEVIMKHTEPEVMVWILWSMKEAAYKIYNRKTGVRAFIPHYFCCSYHTGQVAISKNTYYTSTLLEEEMIHTVAVDEIEKLSGVREISLLNIIKDKQGLPGIYFEGIDTILPASVSHHGRFQKAVYSI